MAYDFIIAGSSEESNINLDVNFRYYKLPSEEIVLQDPAEAEKLVRETREKKKATREQVIAIAKDTLSRYGDVIETPRLRYSERVIIKQINDKRRYTIIISEVGIPEVRLQITAQKTQRLEDLFDCDAFDAQIKPLFEA